MLCQHHTRTFHVSCLHSVPLEAPTVHVDFLQPIQCQGASSSSSKGEPEDLAEINQKLNKTCIDIEKAIKSVTRLTDTAATKDLTSKGETELHNTLSSMEACSKEASDLGFLIKYKKTRDGGEKITRNLAQKAQIKAAKAFAEMMQNAASLKAVLPKPSKDEKQ